MEVQKTVEETAAENVTEETGDKTEETENIADSYQNHRNTCQMDGETILYIL
jgi:hypothetical protein